jgi:2-methylisocitrate lyase-like PEP mutase family enzyme
MLCDYGNIACATSLPVSGDLENGYGESCREVENTIKQSIDFGMVGGSIEDMDMVAHGNLIDVELAVERIVAARESADSTAIPYTLTARCEVYSTNCENPYAVAVDRLNRFREAGADCLFVPGLSSPEDLANLVSDVDGPISFGMGATEQPLSVSLLSELGVRRISTGGGIARAAFSLVRTAAEKILTDGTFEYLENAISDPMINQYLLNHPTTESK